VFIWAVQLTVCSTLLHLLHFADAPTIQYTPQTPRHSVWYQHDVAATSVHAAALERDWLFRWRCFGLTSMFDPF